MTTRSVHRQLEVSEAARREQLGELERLRGLLEVRGPLRSLARAYVTVCDLADPRRGRLLDASRGGSEFDRPLPYAATERWEAVKRRTDRLLDEIAAVLGDALDTGDRGDPAYTRRLDGVCASCGCTGDHRHRRSAVDAATGWLLDLLAAGPVESSALYAQAVEAGHSKRTVERALEKRRHQQRLFTHHRQDGNVNWQRSPVEGSS